MERVKLPSPPAEGEEEARGENGEDGCTLNTSPLDGCTRRSPARMCSVLGPFLIGFHWFLRQSGYTAWILFVCLLTLCSWVLVRLELNRLNECKEKAAHPFCLLAETETPCVKDEVGNTMNREARSPPSTAHPLRIKCFRCFVPLNYHIVPTSETWLVHSISYHHR
ncbi:hypothetical protein VTL71DRAFT_13124 [Oculimacula yallundae]|uniref:Uncharacterized protein n=1 Tax=Oculimacula yallundae TaxID=86028 RepID=A0ABR4CPN8_9HELO